jgi:hypothetical protein
MESFTAFDAPYPKPPVELPVKRAQSFAQLVFLNLRQLSARYYKLVERACDYPDDDQTRYEAYELKAAVGVLNQLLRCFPEDECKRPLRPAKRNTPKQRRKSQCRTKRT